MPVGVSAYVPLANVTLSASAASVTFSSISQAYRDLVLVIEAKGTVDNTYGKVVINSDTGSNYNYVIMQGNGTTAASGAVSSVINGYFSPYDNPRYSTTENMMSTVSFLDYSATDKHKTWIGRSDRAGSGTGAMAGRWASTSAITTLALSTTSSGSFAAGSTFALYGIAA